MEIWAFLFQATVTVFFVTVTYLFFGYLRFLGRFAARVQLARQTWKGRLVRPLEAMEALWEHRQRLGAAIFSVAFFVESRAPLEVEALKAALTRIAAANPMLRMRIDAVDDEDDADYADDAGKNKSKKLEDLLFFTEMTDFRPDVEVLNSTDWNSVMEKDYSDPFESATGPLWRVKMLKGEEKGDESQTTILIFTFHHAIADGRAVVALGDRLMSELSGESVDEWSSPWEAKTPPSYMEFLGQRMRFSWFWSFLLYLGLNFRPSIFSSRSPPCSFASLVSPPINPSPIGRDARLIPFQLVAEDLDELLRRCRQHGCKMQGALQAVVSFAQIEALKRIKAVGSELPAIFDSLNFYAECVRYSIEPLLPASVIGYYSFARSTFRRIVRKSELHPGAFWNLAKSMSDEIHRKKRDIPVEAFMKMGDFIYRGHPHLWMKIIDHPRHENFGRDNFTMDFMMSNYGRFLEEPVGRRAFDISTSYCAINMVLNTACFGHSILSVRGRLFWTINFSERAFSVEQAEIYADCVKKVLKKVVEGKF